jgi:alkanesulfonate monooxygenase SsuD/methylene tetrahydromethanopterin reductase-like flavin-dependent oxidoreductase (luciferase family)
VAISRLAFLIPGNYTEAQPWAGLEDTLDLFALGESLGYDSAWVRQRHLERGISSAATFLAAASQRTSRIGLGAAVIQMRYENPFRLAEDLSLADVLSHGRLQVGLSAGPPPHGPLLGDRFFDGDPGQIDFSHARVNRLRDNLAGLYVGPPDTLIDTPTGAQRPRVQPYAEGLAQRLWYGGGSLKSAQWAGQHGYHLLIGNLCSGEQTDHFFEAQLSQLALYRQARAQTQARQPPDEAPARVALGRVIVPLDSADASSRQHYLAYAESRRARTLQPQGERRTLFANDLVGHADDILAALHADPVLAQVDELRLELPYGLGWSQYAQILSDVATHIAPSLGWHPVTQTA